MHDYNDVIRAIKFACKAHGDQMYGDRPYSYHLQGVAKLVQDRNINEDNLSTLLMIAWLHDVMEDTKVDMDELILEFGYTVAEAVLWLTRYEDENYDDYIRGCRENVLAREVKICDTMFNLQQSFKNRRSKGMKKYPAQLAYLVEEV